MPKDFKRTDRVAEQIKRKLAQLIQLELKDPRYRVLITISDVIVTNDFSHAKVYFTVLSEKQNEIDEALTLLKHAAGFLRRTIGKSLKLRTVPELHFYHDNTITEGNRLARIIDEAISQDEKKSDDDK